MTPFHHLISNFEKKCSIVKKRIFLPKFSQLQVFSRKRGLCKKWNLKAVRLSTFLKYDLTEEKKAPSQTFDLILNMPL